VTPVGEWFHLLFGVKHDGVSECTLIFSVNGKRESVCACVFACERESVCACVCTCERFYVCMGAIVRERERDRERKGERERVRERDGYS